MNMIGHSQQPILCKPCFSRVETDVSFDSLSEVIADQHLPAILGGNNSVKGWSIFTAEPVEVFEFSLHECDPFEKLSRVLSKYQMDTTCRGQVPPGVFCGGWIGYFGYELGRFIEKLPGRAVDDVGFPVIRLSFYDKAVLHDHTRKQYWTVALDREGQTQSVQEKCVTLKDWIRQAENIVPATPVEADINQVSMDTLSCNMSRKQYMAAVAKIKQYIYDGETYQINFSQRYSSDFRGCAIDLFHWQNRFNPSPYSGYLTWDNRAVVSTSPEMFLNVGGNTITTQPIKGTRPRNPALSDEADENKKHFHALVQSEKEQAELAMIVDLERNDLARICKPGTRHVVCNRKIETFPTVYHAVGIVEGKLSSQPGPERIVNILKATFPGGSITGAPKIRSMEIIDALEPTARGMYTGSIGWIGVNFDLCLNIAIRTIIISDQKAYIQTGGGIVADSDLLAEWNETLTKARALLAGVSVANQMKKLVQPT